MLAEIKATAENRMTKYQANLTLTLQNNDEMKTKEKGNVVTTFPDDQICEYLDQSG